MEYGKSYNKLTTIADQIASGAYTSPASQWDESSLVKRRSSSGGGFANGLMAAKGRAEKKPEEDLDTVLAEYMAAMRVPPEEGGGTPTGLTRALGSNVEGPLGAAREALASVESSGNYRATGPVTRSGDRAYGRYQVMGSNVGPWTEQILGKRMTPQEFLADEAAQDAVVEARMQQAYSKYGTWEDAASVWFSGRPIKRAGNSSDGYLTVPEYVSKFQNAFERYK